MGILEKIKAVEDEMARTQKNKATEYHLGLLKAKLAKLRYEQMSESKTKAGPKGDGFDVSRQGDARVALIGFPSVGKSTLQNCFTDANSATAAYEFTTLTCVPGLMNLNDTKVQILDLPGIIEGASQGKGKGRRVIAVAKSCDLVLMICDATKDDSQRLKLCRELESVGIRLNKKPPNISVKVRQGGGVMFNSVLPTTKVDAKMVQGVLQEYKIFNADVLFREDCSIEDLIDVLNGKCVYMKCLFVYNKIDLLSLAQVDQVARREKSVVISSQKHWNLDTLLDRIWENLQLTKIFTKKKGEIPDFSDPIIMTPQRGLCTVENAVLLIHRNLLKEFKHAVVWGRSTKHSGQVVGLGHVLQNEDVVQIIKKFSSKQH